MAIPQLGNSGEEREKKQGSVETHHPSGAHLNISEGSLKGKTAHRNNTSGCRTRCAVLPAPIIHAYVALCTVVYRCGASTLLTPAH